MFGAPSILVDGKPISFPYRKAEALLYYLILEGKASRRTLIAMLWDDVSDAAALKNLRHAVYTVRKTLGIDLFLPGQRTLLEINPDISLQCDVLDFTRNGKVCHYPGDFLSGFSLRSDCPFEDWLMEQRNMLRTQFLKNLLACAKGAFASGALDEAERLSLEYIAQDPLEESVCVLLMELYFEQKKFRKAIGVYHQLCKNLESELSISPLKETTSLYYRIVNEWNSSTYRVEEQTGHPVFGKDLAMKNLLAVCNRPLSERAAPCILIEGEAGVGKTYLLDYILNRYDFSDRLIFRSYCYQSESSVPLASWNSIILSLVSEIEARSLPIPDTYLKTAAGLFPSLALTCGQGYTETDGTYPPQHNYHVAQESTLLILSMVSRQIPLLLVFEDIHWIDRASAELLSAFLHKIRNQNITVICTCRETSVQYLKDFIEKARQDNIMERYTIYPFSKEETQRFIEHYHGGQLEQEQLDQIYHSTGGNALILTQLVNSIRDSDENYDISKMLHSVIGYRLAQLSVEERQVLDMIATFVEWAPMNALASILTRDPVDLMYLCGQLKQRMLVTETTRQGVICFAPAHDMIRSMLVQQQSVSAQRILHLRVAQYLESCSLHGTTDCAIYDRLVYHYERGGNRLNAFKYRIMSLDACARLCYDLLPTLSGTADHSQPDRDTLPSYFRRMEQELSALRRLSGNQDELDQLELILLHAKSRYCIYNGLYEPGLDSLTSLMNLCRETGNTELMVQAHLQYIYYGIQTYDTGVMKEHLDAVRTMLEGLPYCESFGIYLRLRGLHHLMCGNYSEARQVLQQSIHVFRSLVSSTNDRYAINIAGAYNYIAECYRMEHNYDIAFEYYDKAIVYNRSRGYYPGAAVFYTNYGVCAFQKGEYEVALELFKYALEIYHASHEYSAYPVALAYLAFYAVHDKEYRKAAEYFSEAMRVCDVIGSSSWKGIVIYLMWRTRSYLAQEGLEIPFLNELWPDSEEEHCCWALSFLEPLPSCVESEELRQNLRRLQTK